MPVPCSTQLDEEHIATSTPECQASVLVARRHQLLVRCSHWRNVPNLSGPHPTCLFIGPLQSISTNRNPWPGISIPLLTSASGYAHMCSDCTITAVRLTGST